MNTQKIELTQREKEIIVLLATDKYDIDNSSNDFKELEHLEFLGLGEGIKGEFDVYFDFELSSKAKAYLFENPKLKDPSIWDDKKFWIDVLSNLF